MDKSTIEYAIKQKDAFYIDETDSKSGPVVRWNTSNNIPFQDMLEVFVSLGYIGQLELKNSLDQRQIEDRILLEAYRKNFKGYDSETLAEMRSEFGSGAKVVNVLTGTVTQL
jgi:hypothetical protein